MIKSLIIGVMALCAECLDVQRYAGQWYEQRRDKDFIFEWGECSRAKYDLEGDKVLVTNSERRDFLFIKYWTDQKGQLTCQTGSNMCDVQFPLFWGLFTTKGDYQVLETDYDSYTIVYSKGSGFLGSRSIVWILTRLSNPGEAVIRALVDKTKTLAPDYNTNNFRATAQNC